MKESMTIADLLEQIRTAPTPNPEDTKGFQILVQLLYEMRVAGWTPRDLEHFADPIVFEALRLAGLRYLGDVALKVAAAFTEPAAVHAELDGGQALGEAIALKLAKVPLKELLGGF